MDTQATDTNANRGDNSDSSSSACSNNPSFGTILAMIGEVVEGKTQEETNEIMDGFQKMHELLDGMSENAKNGVMEILAKIMKKTGVFNVS